MASTPTLIQSVQRALRLLEAVGASTGRPRPKELARETGLALPTTYHLLRTLVHEDYLARLDDGSYVLGAGVRAVAARGEVNGVLARARPTLRMLRDAFTGPVYLARYDDDDGEIEVLDVADCSSAPRLDLWVGLHDAAHATALGKCILAQLDASSRRDYLARHPMRELTRHTLTDVRALDREVAASGPVTLDHQEYAVGVHCLAAPVSVAGRPGAVAVAVAQGFEVTGAAEEALVEGARRVTRALSMPTLPLGA